MGFEVFDKATASKGKVPPTVTIQRRGMLSLNREAHALLREPSAVELLWDPVRRVIGMRATGPDSPNAHLVRPQSAKLGRGPLIVTATAFARHYDIATDEPRRRVVQLEEDILCVDLTDEGQPAGRSGRSAQRAATVSTEPNPPRPVAR